MKINKDSLEKRIGEFAVKYPRLTWGTIAGCAVTVLCYRMTKDYIVNKFKREEKHPEYKEPPYEHL